jgi:regulator of RNase E activity RraA
VSPGDLIHGDVHGVQTVPLGIAERVPAKAQQILQQRKELIACCQSNEFSLPNLRRMVQELKS